MKITKAEEVAKIRNFANLYASLDSPHVCSPTDFAAIAKVANMYADTLEQLHQARDLLKESLVVLPPGDLMGRVMTFLMETK